MNAALKSIRKVFCRNKQLSVLYGILLSAQIAYLIRYVHHLFAYHNYALALREVLKPCVIGMAVFLFLGYELAVSLWENKLDESLRATAKGPGLTAGALAVFLAELASVCTAVELAGLAALFSMTGVGFAPFLWHNVNISLLYIFVPMLAGGFIGCALAVLFKGKRAGAYLCAIVFLLLNTDFVEIFLNIPYNYFEAKDATIFLYQVKRFFTLVPMSIDSSYSIDTLYGVPMEPAKWLLGGFWLALPLTLFLLGVRGSFPRKKLAAGGAAVLLSLLGIYTFTGLENTLSFNRGAGEYINADQTYYIMEDNEQEREDADPGFSISAYDMTLDIGRKLQAEVTVSLEIPDTDGDKLHFTLYHGYALSDIRRPDGTEIPFFRQGDTVTVSASDLAAADAVVFRYKGYSAKYYSTAQGVFLPAYFPWYPMAGIRNVWNDAKAGTNTSLRETEARFSVTVNTSGHVYSNLDGDGQSFAGTARGVTLCAGLAAREGNIVYAPLRESPVTRQSLEALEEFLEKLRKDCFLPYELPALEDCVIFQTPENYAVNSCTEDMVFCGDHVLMYSSDVQSSCTAILEQYIPCGGASEQLQKYVANYLVFEQDIIENHTLDGYSAGELAAGLKEFKLMDEEQRFLCKYEVLYPVLYSILHEPDSARALWDYFSDDGGTDYVDFLIQLVEG